MAVMYPAACPATANAAESAVFAALAGGLDAHWTAWFQPTLPGREPAGRAATRMRADFVLLGPTGLCVVEVKGWRAASVVDADESTVSFRNGARAQHPLVQAYRYAAALAGLLRAQPGVLAGAAIPVRYAAALPYVGAADLAGRPWGVAFDGPRLLLAGTLGSPLLAHLAAIPPPGGSVTPPQAAAVARLWPAPPPPAEAPRLFDG